MLLVTLVVHHAAGMNACISVGKLTEARTLIQDMKQQNIPADIRVFNILLKGYSRKGGVAAVSGIMQEVSDAGLKPSAVTYNTLIDTYVNAGQLPQARQTCSDALNAGQRTTLNAPQILDICWHQRDCPNFRTPTTVPALPVLFGQPCCCGLFWGHGGRLPTVHHSASILTSLCQPAHPLQYVCINMTKLGLRSCMPQSWTTQDVLTLLLQPFRCGLGCVELQRVDQGLRAEL